MISQPIYYPPVGQGTLRVTPQQAHVRPSIIPFNKLKLFCRIKLGKVYQETAVDLNNNNNPIWSSELTFKRTNEDSFKVELCHKTILSTTEVVGICTVQLQNIFVQQQVIVNETLYGLKTGAIGGVKIYIRWEPDTSQNSFQVGAPFAVNAALAQSQYAPNVSSMPQNITIPQNMLRSGGTIFVNVPNNNVTVMSPQNQGFVVGTPGYQPQPQYSNYQTGYSTPNMNYGSPTHQPYPQTTQYQQGGFMSPGGTQVMYGQQPGYQGMPNPVKGMAMMGMSMDPVLKNEEEKEIEEEIVGPDFPEDQKCIVCMEKRKSGAFYKCGHNCCCVMCAKKFKGKTCPICREPVYDVIKVFTS